MLVHRAVSFLSLVSQALFIGLWGLSAQAQPTAPSTIPGQFAVSDTGAATYRIPIQVPPGVAGIEPKLELVYNSHSGNGLMGVGWGLAGLSSITRCPRTMASDDARGTVSLTANDRFCLDGQRLMLVAGTGTYGSAGSEYRTEIESFAQIKALGALGDGPVSFVVKTKAGLTMEYGNTTDARALNQSGTLARAWALNKVSDIKTNTLSVAYYQSPDHSVQVPMTITYGGNTTAAITGTLSVSIEYDTSARIDKFQGYVAGSLVQLDRRISNVKTYANSVLVKDYRLAYAASTQTGRYRISGITECDGLGSCLQPTTTAAIDVGTKTYSAPASWVANYGVSAGGWSDSNLYPRRVVDVNGDGLPDVVGFASDGVKVSLNTGTGFAAPAGWINNFGTVAGGWTNNNLYPRQLVDVNGDGLPDIVGFFSSGVMVSLNTGSAFATPTTWVANFGTAAGGWIDNNVNPRTLVDVNGDGRPDIVGFSGTGVMVSLNTGTGFTTPTRWVAEYGTPSWTNNNVYPRTLVDVNGDGLPDVVGFAGAGVYVALNTGTSFTAPTFWVAEYGQSSWTDNNIYPRTLVDVNGDGLPDVVGFAGAGVYVALNTGTSFAAPSFWLSYFGVSAGGWANNSLYPRQLADVNGDGLPDVVGFASNGVYVAFNTGTAFAAATNWVANFGTATGGYVDDNVNPRIVADVNGDGLADVVGFANAGVMVSLPSSLASPDRVTLLTTGAGGTPASFGASYGSLTHLSHPSGAISSVPLYAKDGGVNTASFPRQDLRPSLFVVSESVRNDGVGAPFRTYYNYGGLKSDVGAGRGPLGFRWMKRTDVDTGKSSYTEYRQDWPYVGIPLKNETRLTGSGNAGVLKRTTLAADCKIPQTAASCAVAPGGLYFPHVTSRVDQSWDLSGAAYPTEVTNTAYNLNTPDTELRGDPTQITVSAVHDGFVSSRATANEYYAADTTNWILGRLKKTTVTHNGSTALPGGLPGEITVLGLTVTPTSATVQLAGAGTGSTSVSATASGGVGPYLYTWTRITGSRTVITNGNTANPTFAATLTAGEDFTETLRVTLTDALGGSTYRDVSVQYSAGFSFKPIIKANTANYNLRAEAIAANWDQVLPLLATVTVNPGVIVSSPSTATPAFDTGVNFPVGSILKLVNGGAILGMGGAGGNSLAAGNPGGPALKAQYPLSVTNNGTVAGGGGGGGAGAFWSWNGYNRSTAGSGGASGLVAAPGGLKLADQAPAPNGNPSYDSNYNGDMDTFGASANWGWGGRMSSPGGKGGAWGVAGDAGGNVDGAYNLTGYAGGAAGAAAQGSNYITWQTLGTRLGSLDVIALGLTVTPASANVQVNGSGTGSTSVTAAGSTGITPYAYSWARQTGTRTVITNGNTATPTFSATLAAGESFTETMRVTLTDAVGATTYRDVNVQYATGFVFNQTISVNTSNYNLRAAAVAAGWDQVVRLLANVTINAGVYVYSPSTANYAFDTGTGFTAGSTLVLINNGYIVGMGGAGGRGGAGDYTPAAVPGSAGGPALRAQNAIFLTNNGTIGGGGGGGGGGSGTYTFVNDQTYQTTGGGGGGGRGGPINSAGGLGGPLSLYPGGIGNTGGAGTSATTGIGGAGAGGGGAGGAGGGYGTGGLSGSSGNGPVNTPAAGGSGGAAVVGNANITWQVPGTRLGALN